MNNIISQNFKNVLKNKIKILISQILYKTIDNIVENIFIANDQNQYFQLFANVQDSIRNLIKTTMLTSPSNIIKQNHIIHFLH